MINRFLQFIKKQSLAVTLARHDLLFLTEGLSVFDSVRPFASLFRIKSSLSVNRRMTGFLREENNPLLFAFAKEAAVLNKKLFVLNAAKNIFLENDILFKSTSGIRDARFYITLFASLIERDLPQLGKDETDFDNALDIVMDMRLYGAELESLYDRIGGLENCCGMEIDWIKTSSESLYLHFAGKCVYTQKLNLEAQKNLSCLFAAMLLEKSVFVSYWNGIMVSQADTVGFLDFDTVYMAGEGLKNYAFAYINKKAAPKTPREYKLHRALQLLEHYCADIDCFAVWNRENSAVSGNAEIPTHTALLRQLKENGFNFGSSEKTAMTNPKEVAYLLDKNRHKKDPRFRKSSIYYWGPLLITIYILFRFF